VYYPIAELPKSPDGRGDSDRETVAACLMESGTPGHMVYMCSHVCNPRA